MPDCVKHNTTRNHGCHGPEDGLGAVRQRDVTCLILDKQGQIEYVPFEIAGHRTMTERLPHEVERGVEVAREVVAGSVQVELEALRRRQHADLLLAQV